MTPCRTLPGGKGYGSIQINGERVALHRWIVEQVEGPLAPGEVVRHKCDNPPCFLYEHLVRGTKTQNTRDMLERGRGRNGGAWKAHCPQNHPYSGDNVRTNPGDGARYCVTCNRERQQARRTQAQKTQATS